MFVRKYDVMIRLATVVRGIEGQAPFVLLASVGREGTTTAEVRTDLPQTLNEPNS